MEAVHNIEKSLEGIWKDLPHLPKSVTDAIANILQWLVIIGAVLQVWAAYALYSITTVRTVFGLNIQPFFSATDKAIIFVGCAMLLVEAVLLFRAYPLIKERKKAGWDLLFVISLLGVAYSVVQLFISTRGFGSFITSLIGAAIGFYLLFEIKSYFGDKKTAPKSQAPKAITDKE